MNKALILKVQTRNKEGKKQNRKPDNGYIPAVIYGQDTESQSLLINENDFNHVYNAAGESNLINLEIDNQPAVKVLVKDIQRNPLKDNFIHVDFYKVNMNKKITAEIPLTFIGESRAVKELGGMLVRNMDSVEIECLPNDLVNDIKVDLSVLNSLNDIIHVSDLKLSDELKVISEADNVIVNVVEPAGEEQAEEKPIEEEQAGEKSAESGSKGEEIKGKETAQSEDGKNLSAGDKKD